MFPTGKCVNNDIKEDLKALNKQTKRVAFAEFLETDKPLVTAIEAGSIDLFRVNTNKETKKYELDIRNRL